MRVLSLHEDPKVMAANLSKAIGRPVVICSGQKSIGGTHYRLPGEPESRYRWIPEISRYLSPFCSNTCVRRVGHGEYGTPSYHSDFYFDLEVSRTQCLAFPLRDGEKVEDFRKVVEETTGIFIHYLRAQMGASEEVSGVRENGLIPFLQEVQTLRGKTLQGLYMAQTEMFQTPMDRRETWHLNTEIPDRGEGETRGILCTIIRPPGYYSYDAGSLEEHSAYGICDRDPGECSVCQGKSGQRKHFGALHVGNGTTLKGLICLDCFSGLADFLQGQK